MILNGEGWDYIAVRKLPALLREITSRTKDDFYCLNSLHSLRAKSRLESHKKVYENKYFCGIIMVSKETKIL